MHTKFIEASNRMPSGACFNHGKFLVSHFDADEWNRISHLPEHEGGSLLVGRGWGREHIFVMDLQTGEGATFRHGGSAAYDLREKHNIWTCPLFLPFLTWLYEQDVTDLDALPDHVEFTEAEAPSSMVGERGGRTYSGR